MLVVGIADTATMRVYASVLLLDQYAPKPPCLLLRLTLHLCSNKFFELGLITGVPLRSHPFDNETIAPFRLPIKVRSSRGEWHPSRDERISSLLSPSN